MSEATVRDEIVVDDEVLALLEESDEERQARLAEDFQLDEISQRTVDRILDRLLLVVDELSGHPLYGYQKPFARRLLESLIINDGATITALFSRQSGKSETVANTVAAAMIMLPILSKVFPELLDKYTEGLWVGCFGPTDDQTDIIFGRIVARLTSEHAMEFLSDPDIDDQVARGRGGGHMILQRSGSFIRRQTAHPRAKIEGRTYHLILIDECFPAGTPVLTSEGWVPIEEIATNGSREWIVATQGADGLEWARVRTGYRTRRRNDLVRVVHEHGTLYATANHPFLVDGEEVPAIHLRPGTALSLVSRTPEPALAVAEAMSSVDHGGLQQLASGAASERDGTALGTGEDGRDVAQDGTSPYYPWGKREWVDETSADAARRLGTGVDRRVCDPVWRREEAGGSSNPLQDRSGVPGADAGGRGRRVQPQHPGPTGPGRAEDLVARESRVVSVAVLEPGSAEFDQFSDRADYVYTLEVDHPSHTYVAAGVVVGNCQDADERVVNKSISPMGASTNATMVMIGTPSYHKGVFYKTIKINKRTATKRGARQNHYEADWREAAKWNRNYEKFVKKEMLRVGEDSDEFRLSYRLHWLLDKGMFTTSERLDDLGDVSMQTVSAWHKTPVVVGIDPARKQDSTVVTVVWVNWDYTDEFGYYEHRVLNWLDLTGLGWEEQFHRMHEFLANYNIFAIGVDSGGLGDVVISRLQVMMPRVKIEALSSQRPEQSKRWKHLKELLDRGLVGWPSHSKTRRLKTYKRFRTQMEDLETAFEGPYIMAAAPKAADAHDDYADSLAMACVLTHEFTAPEVEVSVNPFY